MEAQKEKVYVALGNELQDGFKTLAWTLRRWRSQPISIVILHVTYNISGKDYVYTPFGKLLASSVSDEKLKILRKYEQEKIDKILSKYIAFCGKVKAEILKVEKYDESIHKVILDLVSEIHITKLVIGFTFIKSSSWRQKSAISVSFYIHEHKAESCELFIICGGKEVFLRGVNDRRIMEDDKGVMVAKVKDKGSFKFLLEKMFLEHRHSPNASSTKTDSAMQDQWEKCVQEMEIYYQHLCSNLDEQVHELGNGVPHHPSPTEAIMLELNGNRSMSLAEKFEFLRRKISEAHERTRMMKKEAMENGEKHAKAERAVCLCEHRAQDLDARIKEEANNKTKLQRELDIEKAHTHEVANDIGEVKNKIKSLIELQSELSQKLHHSKVAKAQAEVQLENEVMKRAEMVREIDLLRRQRDVFARKIEFCREKDDASGMAASLSELISCCLREYTDEEIKFATEGFSEHLRLKTGGDLSSVYKGQIDHVTVAIKVLNPVNQLSKEDFQAKVKLISHIRHPHLLAMMGYCSQPNSLIFEYMHNGSLRDALFSPTNKSIRAPVLRWHDRIRIAAEVCSAVCYLHMARPKPIVHGQISASNILLDRNLVAKVSGFGLNQSYYDESHVRWDVRAFGLLTLTLLTGRNWVDEAMLMDKASLVRVLDEKAGPWPMDLADGLMGVVIRCLSINNGPNIDLKMATVMEELDEIRKKANALVARGLSGVNIEESENGDVCNDVPRVFLCPILQEVMKDPHVAADGISYEREAIDEWLAMGRDISPMTNLKLKHMILIPNHTLRSLAQDWHYKRSVPYP